MWERLSKQIQQNGSHEEEMQAGLATTVTKATILQTIEGDLAKHGHWMIWDHALRSIDALLCDY